MTASSVTVPMPRLSDSMEEGTVVQWLVADGDEVAVGEQIVEIETDKATMTYEAEVAGAITLLAQSGATVAVGEPIARFGGDADEPVAVVVPAAVAGADSTARTMPADTPVRRDRVWASPVARRMAAEHAIDLREINGSGPRGRVTKADVHRAIACAPHVSSSAPVSTELAATPSADRRVPLTRVQQTIAARMVHAKATIPEFTVSVDVDMSAAVALRAELRRTCEQRTSPSVNDMVVRAVGLALREHPRLNASLDGDELVEHADVHVGVAVATEGSLLVPVVRDADASSLTSIAERTRELSAKVRAATVSPAELEGGTFTVSNLGMRGVDDFVAVLNAPQVGILAVSAIVDRPVARDGAVVVAPLMRLTLTADHRVVYGADAAGFVASVRELLAAPLNLLS